MINPTWAALQMDSPMHFDKLLTSKDLIGLFLKFLFLRLTIFIPGNIPLNKCFVTISQAYDTQPYHLMQYLKLQFLSHPQEWGTFIFTKNQSMYT